MENKSVEFKKELKALMVKYEVKNIRLDFSDFSDTHGMYDEAIKIEDINGLILASIEGYYLTVSDL